MRFALVVAALAACGSKSDPATDKSPPKTTAPADHVDSSTYDKTCATADDCVIVDEWKCDKCGCSDKVIAKKGLDKYQAALQATQCEPDKRVCGECRPFVAGCEAGKCTTHPAP